jgi:hypothetical protein
VYGIYAMPARSSWRRCRRSSFAARPHEIEVAEQELLQDPDAEEEERRQLENREEEDDEDDGHDPRAREQQQVTAEHAGHRAGRPDRRDRRVRINEDLTRVGGQAAQDVEHDELDRSHGVLDVVAEDPQEQHVAPEVQQASVHEHRREQRQPRRGVGSATRRVADLIARVRDLVGDRPVLDRVALEVE